MINGTVPLNHPFLVAIAAIFDIAWETSYDKNKRLDLILM